MVIRQENENDYDEVHRLVQAAFATTPYSDGTEADYLRALRKRAAFLPALSLVAEEDGQIVGQIVLYQTDVRCAGGTVTQLVLSPLSVHPSRFRQGIGRALIAAACERAAAMGYRAVFLCGEPGYYEKSGFVPSYRYGIHHARDADKNAAWCMARELTPGYLAGVRGVLDIE